MTTRTLLITLALFALIACTYAGTLPASKIGQGQWWPRKDNWLVVTGRSFQYTNIDGSQFTLPSGSYISFGGTAAGRPEGAPDVPYNDVWVSTDTAEWILVSGRTPNQNSSNPDSSYIIYTGQAECQDVVSDRLYVVGGELPNVALNPAFRSDNGGKTWTAFTLPTNRSYGNCMVDSKSKLYVLNGILNYSRPSSGAGDNERRQPSNDVWVSSNYGASFERMPNALYSERMAASAAAVLGVGPKEDQDLLYVVGGLSLAENGTEVGNTDVWVSQDGATRWRRVSQGKFPVHIDTTLIVSRKGILLLVGGRDTTWYRYSEIYGSMDGGSTWGHMSPASSVGWTGRIFPAAVFDKNGFLHMMGGDRASGGYANDVFASTVSLEVNLPATANYLELAADVWYPSQVCLGLLPCSAPLGTTQVGVLGGNGRFHHVAFDIQQSMTFNVRVGDNFPAKSFPAGSMIVAGGENSNRDNDVWISADGTTDSWYLIGGVSTNGTTKYNSQKPDSSYGYAFGQGICNNFNGDIVMIVGGEQNSQPTTTSYVSTDAGATWTLNPTSSQVFTKRSWAVCGFDSNNVVYLTGGVLDYAGSSGDNRDLTNDVWHSVDLGKTWIQVKAAAPYTPRGAAGFAIAYQQGADANIDLIYVVGGFTDVNEGRHADALNDVWVSADSGLNWVRTTAQAPWVKRADHAVTVSRAGVLIVSGGRTDGQDVHGNSYVFNDVWVSFDGGYSFFLVEQSPYTPRRLMGLFVDLKGNLVTVGGEGGTGVRDAFNRQVWKTTAVNFNKPQQIFDVLHKDDQAAVVGFDGECSGYLVKQGQKCPAYLDEPSSGLSTGAIAAIVILVLVVVLGTCGWAVYSIYAYGEVRIPFTQKSCNCFNNAFKGDQLADDGFALHKGTGKLKNSLNGSLHHRLIDE
jgi:hypothetical protein